MQKIVAEQGRIPHMAKTGAAAANVDLLLRARLLADRQIRPRLEQYLRTRSRGPPCPPAASWSPRSKITSPLLAADFRGLPQDGMLASSPAAFPGRSRRPSHRRPGTFPPMAGGGTRSLLSAGRTAPQSGAWSPASGRQLRPAGIPAAECAISADIRLAWTMLINGSNLARCRAVSPAGRSWRNAAHDQTHTRNRHRRCARSLLPRGFQRRARLGRGRRQVQSGSSAWNRTPSCGAAALDGDLPGCSLRNRRGRFGKAAA